MGFYLDDFHTVPPQGILRTFSVIQVDPEITVLRVHNIKLRVFNIQGPRKCCKINQEFKRE